MILDLILFSYQGSEHKDVSKDDFKMAAKVLLHPLISR